MLGRSDHGRAVDLLDRGRTIGALESTSLTLLSAGLVALGYAGWEYFRAQGYDVCVQRCGTRPSPSVSCLP